jgi:hypothetical protein
VPTTISGNLGVQGSIRGRVGYAWDRVLLYATGGVAFAGFNGSISTPYGYDSASTTRVGRPFPIAGAAPFRSARASSKDAIDVATTRWFRRFSGFRASPALGGTYDGVEEVGDNDFDLSLVELFWQERTAGQASCNWWG